MGEASRELWAAIFPRFHPSAMPSLYRASVAPLGQASSLTFGRVAAATPTTPGRAA